MSKAGEREGVAGLEGSGRVDEAGGLGGEEREERELKE